MRKVLYILGQMTDQDVDWMAQAGKRRQIPAGTVVIAQGKPIDSIYILLDGTMSVEVERVGQIATLNCGEIVGEMSFVDSRPPSATVKAATACVALELPRDTIRRKLDLDVGFSARFHRAIARFLSDRLRATMHRFAPAGGSTFDDEAEGELDLDMLGDIHMAGARFDGMLKKLLAR